MYDVEIREHLDRTFRKLAKKDPVQMKAIAKKIEEIAKGSACIQASSFPACRQEAGARWQPCPGVLDRRSEEDGGPRGL